MKPMTTSPFAPLLLAVLGSCVTAAITTTATAYADPDPPPQAAPAAPDHQQWLDKALALDAPADDDAVLPGNTILQWRSPQRPIAPDVVAAVDIDHALAWMAAEERAQRKRTPAERRAIYHGDQNRAVQSLLALAIPGVIERMSDSQRRMAAALGVALLEDETVVSDASPVDGPRVCVMHIAAHMLDAVAGRSFGQLSTGGRGYTDATRMLEARVHRDWPRWWAQAAGAELSTWATLTIVVPTHLQWHDKAMELPAPAANAAAPLPAGVSVNAPARTPVVLADEDVAAVSIDVALACMAAEARECKQWQKSGSPRGGLGWDHRVVRSLAALTHPKVIQRMSDDQRRLAAALGVELLDDNSAVMDFTARDGARFNVQHYAQRMLEAVAGRTFGDIFMDAGMMAPTAEKHEESARAHRDWPRWWARAASAEVSTWPTLKLED